MEAIHIRVIVVSIATLTAITFILLSYLLPEHSVIILTIEVIILPTIYIIGNCYAEYFIKKDYEEDINSLYEKTESLNEKYINQKLLISSLNDRIKILKKDGEKN